MLKGLDASFVLSSRMLCFFSLLLVCCMFWALTVSSVLLHLKWLLGLPPKSVAVSWLFFFRFFFFFFSIEVLSRAFRCQACCLGEVYRGELWHFIWCQQLCLIAYEFSLVTVRASSVVPFFLLHLWIVLFRYHVQILCNLFSLICKVSMFLLLPVLQCSW